jgi:anti-sigma-K factor RskA
MEYQVWRIKGGTPVGAGMFSSSGMDEQLIVISADLSDADAIGISIEPRGGSSGPTGAIVLLGT